MPVEPTMRAVRVPGAGWGCCGSEGIQARCPDARGGFTRRKRAVRDLNASDVASYVPVFRGEAESAGVVEEAIEVKRDGGPGFLRDFVFDGEIEVVCAVAQ